MNIKFERTPEISKCLECGEIIEQFAPCWYLEFEKGYIRVDLCEDCGNNLSNNMDEEYSEFVELGK